MPELLAALGERSREALAEGEEERADLQAIVEGWLDPEGRDLTGEPAEAVGDGGAEEADWREWVLPIFALVTAQTLDVSPESTYALTWQSGRALVIRKIMVTTATALDGTPSARVKLVFGLTPANVAGLDKLEAELRKRGATEEEIAARLQADALALRLQRAALIAETETVAAHAGAVTAAWSEGLALGLISADTRRQWRADPFSLICSVCAFLDRQVVGINEPFIGPGGEIFSPLISSHRLINFISSDCDWLMRAPSNRTSLFSVRDSISAVISTACA